MELQQFGTIETRDGVANAMLCRDADRPDEFMMHWWGSKTKPMAALVRGVEIQTGIFELTPLGIYHTNKNGGLWLPPLSDEDSLYVRTVRATLHKKNSVL